jgi:hypothetical protein
MTSRAGQLLFTQQLYIPQAGKIVPEARILKDEGFFALF